MTYPTSPHRSKLLPVVCGFLWQEPYPGDGRQYYCQLPEDEESHVDPFSRSGLLLTHRSAKPLDWAGGPYGPRRICDEFDRRFWDGTEPKAPWDRAHSLSHPIVDSMSKIINALRDQIDDLKGDMHSLMVDRQAVADARDAAIDALNAALDSQGWEGVGLLRQTAEIMLEQWAVEAESLAHRGSIESAQITLQLAREVAEGLSVELPVIFVEEPTPAGKSVSPELIESIHETAERIGWR